MVSKQEVLVRKTGKKLNPSIPIEYGLLPFGVDIPVRAWTDFRKAVVKLDESWSPGGSFLERKGEVSGLEAVCRDVVAHEVAGHVDSLYTKGCPGVVDAHALMKHNVMKAMREAGKASGAGYLTNAVQDVFANMIIRGIEGNTNAGITLFFEKNLQSPSAFYEAFVKLNLACWGSVPDVTHLRNYFTGDNDVNGVWKNVVKELGLRVCDWKHNYGVLTNQDKWADYAYVMAKYLAPLLDDDVVESTCPHGNTPQECNNPFDVELDDPVVQRRVARKFYDEGLGVPEFMKDTDALLRLYESLGDMPVHAKAETRSIGVPIIPFQWRATQDLSRASFTKFGIRADDDLEFFEPVEKLDVPFHYRKHDVDFPDLVVAVLDRSPSMLDALEPGNNTNFVPWGDKSKWHYALWGWFAMTNDLARTGKISRVRNNALLFATRTQESGAYKGNQLDSLRRWILEHPPSEYEGTNLDIERIRTNCVGKPKVFITMSDGEVANWPEHQEEFLKLIAPHKYVHIQIGQESAMSKTLRENKRRVYSVTQGKDLVNLMRGIIAEAYNV